MVGMLWRQPYLVDLTYREAIGLVSEAIKHEKSKILDVGCGTGSMSLELARSGHDVLGIDIDKQSIGIANRTMREDSSPKRSGSLEYEMADFGEWPSSQEKYDAIIFSRILHDLSNPEQIVSKAHSMLKDNGRIVCLEYAYDRLDRRTATWLYQLRKLLESAGWYSSPHLSDDPQSGIDHIMKEETSERKEHINTFEEMRKPLEQFFQTEQFSWHCYHSWSILGDMQVPDPEKEKAVASTIKRVEQFLIESGEIESVLFRFIGVKDRSEATGQMRPHSSPNRIKQSALLK
jgi:ubiquinone/menaquinone biosynthesis C-methylase UbiE